MKTSLTAARHERPKHRPGALISLLLALLLAACGQRGPLYLPDPAPSDAGTPATGGTAREAVDGEEEEGDGKAAPDETET
jgi:predicted small lipoprotein YifL